jgi:hypothetical protein
MRNTYVKLTSTSSVHLIKPGTGQTVCGRDYRQYDYIPYTEEELDPGYQQLCHKCLNKRREGPRTIKEAFSQQPYEVRGSHASE